jgi:hypothetical protein
MSVLGKPARVLCAILVAIVVAGCGGSSGTPTAAPLSDPSEILARSAASLEHVKTVHVKIDVKGKVDASTLGITGLSSNITLDGIKIEGDVDIEGQAYHLVLSAPPALFGVSAEIVSVDGYTYTKSSLQPGGKYTKASAGDAPVSIPSPDASMSLEDQIAAIKKSLTDAGATATLEGTEQVDGQNAYHISISIPLDKINETISGAGGSAASGITVDSAEFDMWVYTASLRPAKLQVKGSAGTVGNVDLLVTMSKYDQAVTITAPPADQIEASAS